MKILAVTLPKKKTLGVLGNHDDFNLYDKYGIRNINKTVFTLKNGIRIAGLQGSIKYKQISYPSYSHARSLSTIEKMKPANIIITHDVPYVSDSTANLTHKGIVGIAKYIYDNQVMINLHGHLHNTEVKMLPNGCQSIGVYKAALIEIEDGKININNFEEDSLNGE